MADWTNEKSLDTFADLIEPTAEIVGDPAVKKAFEAGKKLQAAKLAIKNHKKAVVTMLALLDGEDPETYRVHGPVRLATKLLVMLNDPKILTLFTLQGQQTAAGSFGSAMENTEDGAN